MEIWEWCLVNHVSVYMNKYDLCLNSCLNRLFLTIWLELYQVFVVLIWDKITLNYAKYSGILLLSIISVLLIISCHTDPNEYKNQKNECAVVIEIYQNWLCDYIMEIKQSWLLMWSPSHTGIYFQIKTVPLRQLR